MPYVTSIERMGREEGRLESLRENILDILEARFGQAPIQVREPLEMLADTTKLKALYRLAVMCGSLTDFESALLG